MVVVAMMLVAAVAVSIAVGVRMAVTVTVAVIVAMRVLVVVLRMPVLVVLVRFAVLVLVFVAVVVAVPVAGRVARIGIAILVPRAHRASCKRPPAPQREVRGAQRSRYGGCYTITNALIRRLSAVFDGENRI
jgi:hypothetical protein